MSRKNDYLLRRSGRNQFGDPGDPPTAPYQPSAASVARDKQMFALHQQQTAEFVSCHREAWLPLFGSLSRREVWMKLYPRGKPAFSTFGVMVRECGSLEEFILWWLASRKTEALRILGFTATEARGELEIFSECGRYYVSYGKSARIFGTAA
jgi:hypothetical protein